MRSVVAPFLLFSLGLFVGACSSSSSGGAPSNASSGGTAAVGQGGGSGAASGSAGNSGSGGASAGAGGMTGLGGNGYEVPAYDPGPRPSSVSFPPSFLFAAASAGMQVEKGLVAADWHEWADMAGKIANGDKPDDGPDFFGHVDGDVQAMKDAKLGAYRFSIELSRLYPTKEAFDADMPDMDGVNAYEGLFQKLRAAGIVPVVTLQHFAFPTWLEDPTMPSQPQGWERQETVDTFVEWSKRVATRWGKYVDWWVTINEPNVMTTVGYALGLWPPGVSDAERLATAEINEVEAHAKAYDAIHAADTVDVDGDGKAAWVSMAFHNRVYQPKDPMNPDDVAAAAHSTYFWNIWYLEALTKGNLDADFDEKLDGPNDRTSDPTLASRLDYIGLNYYGISLVAAKAIQFPYLGSAPAQSSLPTKNPKTAMGWDIYAAGFGQVIDQIKGYGLPFFITENGVAQQPDEPTRSRFILEHLFEVGWAMQRGADIRGYTYWALTDNFEWQSGFCPEFGLYSVDYTDPARPRKAAQGRDTLASVATSRTIAQQEIDLLPAYPATPAKMCKSF